MKDYIIASVFIVAIFSGCGGSDNSNGESGNIMPFSSWYGAWELNAVPETNSCNCLWDGHVSFDMWENNEEPNKVTICAGIRCLAIYIHGESLDGNFISSGGNFPYAQLCNKTIEYTDYITTWEFRAINNDEAEATITITAKDSETDQACESNYIGTLYRKNNNHQYH